MADEKKNEVKEQPPQPQPKPAEEQKAKVKKNKKIKEMNLQEIEQAIEKTNTNQGGLYSRYSRDLMKRKNYLLSLKK